MSVSNEVLLDVQGLEKAYGGNQVLNGITTQIRRGEVVAIIGPSGCGKSTFLRSLNLLEEPTGGKILFEGTDITDSKVDINRHRQKIGMVFQQFNLFPHKTVKENIMLAPVTLNLMSKEEAEKTALELLGVERYDLVLLDLNLPKKDGMTVLRTLRQTDRETRVLILSARSEVEDKVQGLDAGANDYLAKPFHLAELEARIRSLTLRQFTQQDVLLSCGGLSFDTRSRTAAVNGQTLTLTRKETGILEYLMVHQGRPVSQEELMDHVWDNSVDSFSNSIRVHISALRKKLRAVLGYDPIRNRIGEGYLMGGEEE